MPFLTLTILVWAAAPVFALAAGLVAIGATKRRLLAPPAEPTPGFIDSLAVGPANAA